MKQVSDKYECNFCHSSFEREGNYLKHRCERMKRHEEIKGPIGQAAYQCYSDWMKAHKRMVPAVDVFLTSRFYKSFIRFAKYIKQLNIPDVQVFIRLMKEKDISPTIWTNDQVYALYLEYIDRRLTPIEQAQITIDTLFKIAEERDCSTEDIFTVLHPNEVLQYLRERRLSPWILLHSPQFIKMLNENCSKEQQAFFEALIRPHYWKLKFANHPKYVELMKKYASELNI